MNDAVIFGTGFFMGGLFVAIVATAALNDANITRVAKLCATAIKWIARLKIGA